MPRLPIIERYILREFTFSSLAAVVVLLVIFTGGAFADVVNNVATGQLPATVMFTVLGLNLVKTLQALLPMGMFLGILLALGRMYRDSEMHVLAASGFGPQGLLKPAALFAAGTAIMVALVSLWLAPWAARTSDAEVEQANRSVIAAGLEPGRFTSLSGRGGILFANTISPDGTRLGKLFVESERTGKNGVTSISVITANRGTLFHEGQGNNRYIALYDGHRYDIPLGRDNWRLMQFQRNDIALSAPADNASQDDPYNRRTTTSLVGDHAPAARAELQWRIAMPFGPLVLAMLALPMARQPPRSSPVGRILIAVLAYLVIMNLMTLARSFIASGKLTAPVGLWWVLLPVFIGAAWVFARQYATRTARVSGRRLKQ
ncbi:MAG: LPS export ABC transporter permease LptF [Rhodanobacteraceae bacterium]|nr:MAG: LPS export ABC transporter permease LptF [Rhodanobacteraceae bacterium]